MLKKRFLFIFVLFFAASPVYANVFISEIMYDLEGSDNGREWVEIKNNGIQVDLTGWKFFEANVNHGLTLVQGNVSIPQNEFAIIADNAEKFLLDWPNFSGTIFDSSFSLSNTGETIILRDAGLADIDSVSYSSDWGAGGDANSLQKIEDKWVSSVSTPGGVNTEKTVEQESPHLYQGGGTVVGGSESGSGSVSEPKPVQFYSYAGEDKLALAGAEVYFEGQAKGVSDDIISKVRFLWNFGDGTVGEGRNIKHIFQYPGSYIVNLDTSFGSYSDSDSVKINVSEAGIYVSEIKPSLPSALGGGGWVEIKNESTKIADVSGFGIQINDSKVFSFSKDTKLTANSFLVLDSLTLGLEIPSFGEIKILYPNGKILFSSKYEAKNLSEKESISFDEDPPSAISGGGWVKSEATPGTKNSIKKEPAFVKAKTGEPIATPAATSKIINKNSSIEQQTHKVSPEASVISASFWSEIKWLIFGLGGGVFLGLVYFLLKVRFFTKTEM